MDSTVLYMMQGLIWLYYSSIARVLDEFMCKESSHSYSGV